MPADYEGTHTTQEELAAEEARLAGVIARKGWPEPAVTTLDSRAEKLLADVAKMTPEPWGTNVQKPKNGFDEIEITTKPDPDGSVPWFLATVYGNVGHVGGEEDDGPSNIKGILALRNLAPGLVADQRAEIKRLEAELANLQLCARVMASQLRYILCEQIIPPRSTFTTQVKESLESYAAASGDKTYKEPYHGRAE